MIKRGCILDVDSPSYPPELEEYIQCGCKYCLLAIKDYDMSSKEEFVLASKAFSLMTPQEQGIVLILFRKTTGSIIEDFVESVYKVTKTLNGIQG